MVGSTARVEAFSDAVLAIIITLLVLEIRVPELADPSLRGVVTALRETVPHLLSFTFSFITLAVFWVNHHHFFHELERADWKLLWYNNLLLFFLCLVPFTTAFLGAHPGVPGVAMLYCFILFCAALAFTLMARHAMFAGQLLHADIGVAERRQHLQRSMVGVFCYGLATLLAPLVPPATAALMLFIPVFYITPRLIHDHETAA